MLVVDSLVAPFWRTTRMVAEPVLFTGSAQEPTLARLLFPATSIETVTNVNGTREFKENTDYQLDPATGGLIRPVGSRMPITSPDVDVSAHPTELDERNVAITYAHAPDAWTGHVPPDRSHGLPRSMGLLRGGEPLTICVLGDSISEGYEASAFRGVTPHMPSYAGLTARTLGSVYRGPIRLHNRAIAGSTTEQLDWELSDVLSLQPDLVMLAYGMNDATYASAADFCGRIAGLMRLIEGAIPGVEYLLVSPMVPTPACHWVDPDRIDAYRDGLMGLSKPGVAVADVTSVWHALLERKTPYELSGNGTNHPNDFGHRVYAQTVLAALDALV